MELSDKVALITGASRGIGVGIAKRFGAEGARVAIAARSKPELDQVAKEIDAAGGQSMAFPCDVGDRAALERLVKDVTASMGPVDVLVNNAGIEAVCDFETQPLDQMEAIIRVNVLGPMWLTRLVVPSMIERKSGHVCNLASIAGLTAVPHNSVYSTSKHALVGMSRSLRGEMADHGVEVSVVCPGFVDGGMFASWGRTPPKIAGSVSVDAVVDAVVEAVTRNRAEIVVSKGLGKISDWVQSIAPDFMLANMRRSGLIGFLRDQAKINAGR